MNTECCRFSFGWPNYFSDCCNPRGRLEFLRVCDVSDFSDRACVMYARSVTSSYVVFPRVFSCIGLILLSAYC